MTTVPGPEASAGHPIRVLLADESTRITDNVSRRLGRETDIEVCAVVRDGDAAIQEALRTRPDVAVIDAALPGMDGPQTTEMLTQYLPRTGVIMLSLSAENEAYRRAMLAGAREFLQKPFTGDEMVAAIRRVYAFERRKAAPAGEGPASEPVHRGLVFTVFAGKGGVGKTTIAANLGVAMAGRMRVAVVDCSLQFGDIGPLLNVAPTRTIADLAAGNAVADSEVVQQVLTEGPGGVRVLTAPPSPELADYVTPQHLRALVEELRRSFDAVVIDTASHLGEVVLDAVETADHVLLVTDLSVTSVKNTKLARSVMDVLKLDPDRCLLVVNHREAAGEMERAQAEAFLDLRAAIELPYDPGLVGTSVSQGVPFVLSHPQSPISQRVTELARSLAAGREAAAPVPAAGPTETTRRRPRRMLGLGRR
jgi:pilus assembly protein CpaE